MAPLRVRGPNGVSTVNVLFDSDTFTVLDFQQELYATTGITPSRQSSPSSVFSLAKLKAIKLIYAFVSQTWISSSKHTNAGS